MHQFMSLLFTAQSLPQEVGHLRPQPPNCYIFSVNAAEEPFSEIFI